MKRIAAYLMASFAAVTVFAEEIDAEIIKHLDFFEKMPVVEELDVIELEEQSNDNANSNSSDDPGTDHDDSDRDSGQGG